MKVIIPAAGIGARLRPHTHSAPKALLYVAGKPILGHILDEALSLNPSEVIITVGFLGAQIIDYVEKNYDINVRFARQNELLGLGYAIYLGIDPDETEDLLVILGDTIVETDWTCLLNSGRNVIAVKEVNDPRRFGVVETEGTRITSIVEKPEDPASNLAVVGVYYIKDTQLFREALDEIYNSGLRTNGEFQVTDAFDLMLRKGASIHVCPIDSWYDCGKRETLLETNRHLLESLPNGKTHLSIEGCVVVPPVYIDQDTIVRKSIIGPNVSIAAGSSISNSIVSDSIISTGARVENARLTSSLIGNHAVVKGSFKILNVGDSSEISY